MKSYRIVLEYTEALNEPDDNKQDEPCWWDWHNILNLSPRECVSVVDMQVIETPAKHVEAIGQDAVDELTEIAQKHNMGY